MLRDGLILLFICALQVCYNDDDDDDKSDLPTITGLYRNSPAHETVSHLQQRCNQRMLFML